MPERPDLRCFVTQSPARLLKPREVARLFAVEVSTVLAWARGGKIPAIRTPGGQHRFRSSDVNALVGESTQVEVAN